MPVCRSEKRAQCVCTPHVHVAGHDVALGLGMRLLHLACLGCASASKVLTVMACSGGRQPSEGTATAQRRWHDGLQESPGQQ